MFAIKVIASAVGALVSGFFGVVFCFGDMIYPLYRTVEVSAEHPFGEQWMSSQEFWISVLVGVALLGLSIYLCRTTYRIIRHAHNVA